MENNDGKVSLLELATQGLTRSQIIEKLNISQWKYNKILKEEFNNKKSIDNYKKILRKNLNDGKNKDSYNGILLVADDYLLSYKKDIFRNEFEEKMYILPQTLQNIRNKKIGDTNIPIPIFSKLLLALNNPQEKIEVLEKYTFYDNEWSFLVNLIKVALLTNACVLTNDPNTIYYCLLNGIRIKHTIETGLDPVKIIDNKDKKICIYDTSYLFHFMNDEEMYDNFPKIIFSCVLEEVVIKYDQSKSIQNLLYKLVDAIQSTNFNLKLEFTNAAYSRIRGFNNDMLVLSHIMKNKKYQKNCYLKTADQQLRMEALLCGVTTSFFIDKYYVNIMNEYDNKRKDIALEDECIFIPVTKIQGKYYMSSEVIKTFNISFISQTDFERVNIGSFVVEDKEYFPLKDDIFILTNKKVYKKIKVSNVKGSQKNFEFVKKI